MTAFEMAVHSAASKLAKIGAPGEHIFFDDPEYGFFDDPEYGGEIPSHEDIRWIEIGKRAAEILLRRPERFSVIIPLTTVRSFPDDSFRIDQLSSLSGNWWGDPLITYLGSHMEAFEGRSSIWHTDNVEQIPGMNAWVSLRLDDDPLPEEGPPPIYRVVLYYEAKPNHKP